MKSDRRFFKELRFRQLRALVELSRQNTFSAMASALGLSVVSAWRQVRSIEEEFGVQLLVTNGQQVSLTEDGRALVEMAQPLVESFLSLRAVFEDRQSKVSRKLTVAAPAGVLSDALPEPVTIFRRKFPNVELRLMDRPSRAAAAALLAGQADIAIVGLTMADELPAAAAIHPLTRYPIHLLCRADHALANAKRITVKQIARFPLVLSSEDTGMWRRGSESPCWRPGWHRHRGRSAARRPSSGATSVIYSATRISCSSSAKAASSCRT